MMNPNIVFANSYKGVVISWDDLYDGEGLAYAIVRNPLDYPQNINDGTMIYKGEEHSFVDTTVENGKTYYYSLYYVENYELTTDSNCNFVVRTVFLENGYAQRLYRRFPGFWRRYDALIDTDNEELNRPFLRICRVIGYEFDKIETLLNSFYDNIDIDTCNYKMLPMLMAYLGVEYDWHLTITENRMLAKIFRSAYSRKGCVSSLKLVLMNLLKSDVNIVFYNKRVRRDADESEIAKKRTISIVANNFQPNFVWIEENYEKFLEVIQEFVPKKFSVKLVIVNNFIDEYVKTNMIDTYKVYNNDLCVFVDKPRKKYSDGNDSIEAVDYHTEISDAYTKTPTETVAIRFIEGRRRIDVCSAPEGYSDAYGNDDVSVQTVFSDESEIEPSDNFTSNYTTTIDDTSTLSASDNYDVNSDVVETVTPETTEETT